MSGRCLSWLVLVATGLCAGEVRATELVNDGWTPGAAVGFQVGFQPGEIGASRFVPAGPCPCFVSQVTFLFGGDGATRNITLRIYDDAGGGATPGAEIFSAQYQVMGSDLNLQLIDLSGDGVFVNGAFRVGIEFETAGLPSIARDDDGDIQPNTNFILADGLGWFESSIFGLTGDWIIRATVEEQGDLTEELKNDSWPPTLTAAFQAGFAAGEAAAVRLSPPGPCPCPLNGVSVLIGGAPGMADVGLRIWDDSALTDDPGTLLYTTELNLVSADAVINIIDLSAELITVDGPFRLGFVLNNAGLPSVARDDDGITPGVNFIDADGLGWLDSGLLGLTGDWIMRAVVTDQNLQTAALGHDDWDALTLPAFQEGFEAGEIASVRLDPGTGVCPCLVTGARLMFGGAPGSVPVTVRVWEDAADATPGTEIHNEMVTLDANDLALNTVDLSATPILVSGPFRIGVEFSQAGLPSVARDHDGVVPGRNYIRDDMGTWMDATDLGVPGDWIIRASIFPVVIFTSDFEGP